MLQYCMNELILFVGDTGPDVAVAAKKFDASAVLVDLSNFDTVVGVGYTSIGDLTRGDRVSPFVSLLERASEIYYIEPVVWSHSHTQSRTKFWLRYYSFKKKVYNIDTTFTHPVMALEDNRKVDTKQLWVAGCSYTVGHGLDDVNSRWANLVSEKLKLPVSVLAKFATSIPWASDQILRSDIRPDDIVIWGLTEDCRFPYYEDGQIQHVTVHTYPQFKNIHPIISNKVLTTDYMLYQAITAIDRVIADSKKVGYQLMITQFPLFSSVEHEFVILDYLSQFDFFFHHYVDYRADWLDCLPSTHPGPKQHAHYADLFVNYLTKEHN